MASTVDTEICLGAGVDSSPPKVVFHGDLAEFRDQHRCESCIARNKKCILQRGEESCMFCSDADRSCVFERRIQLQGSALRSHWNTLVTLRSLFDLQYPDDLESRDVSPYPSPSLIMDDVDRRSDTLPSDRGTWARKRLSSHPKTRATVEGEPVRVAFQPPRSRPSLPPTSLQSQMQWVKGKRARGRVGPLPNESSLHAAKVRKLGACMFCKRRKIRCTHVSFDTFRKRDSISPPVSLKSNSRDSLSADDEPVESVSSSPAASTSILKRHIEMSSKSPVHEKLAEPEHSLIQTRRLLCPVPGCKLDFRGEHELTRHHERVHRDQRAVWVCNDISESKTALAGCKSCEAGKQYNVDYNAVQHLRRCHVAVKSRPQTEDEPVGANSAERKGLVEVPNDSMEELRKWLRKEWIKNKSTQGSEDAAKRGTTRVATRLAEADWENELEDSFKTHPQQDAGWQTLPENSYEPSQPIQLF